MNQSDFEAIVWKQWAKAPNGEIQPEELRPMKDAQNSSQQDIKANNSAGRPYRFRAWAEPYPNEDDPWMLHPMKANLRVIQSVIGIEMESLVGE